MKHPDLLAGPCRALVALVVLAVGCSDASTTGSSADAPAGPAAPDGAVGGSGGGSGVFQPPPCTDEPPERCNGLDDDCDGVPDDGFDVACGPCDGGEGGCLQVAVQGGAWHEGTHRNVAIGNDKGLHLPPVPVRSDYVWVANSPNDTVSKIHASSATEQARFRVGDNPSRTAVDGNGDAWIAMRGDIGDSDTVKGQTGEEWESVVKIDGDCVPALSAPTPTRECILLDVPEVGNLLRGLAIDARNDVWVGAHASQELIHLDGETGVEIARVKVQKTHPYGLAVDEWGYVWVASVSGDEKILRVDPVTLDQVVIDPVTELGRWPYGIGADGAGRVWFGSNLEEVFSVDIETLEIRDVWTVGEVTRGVAIDDDGYLWAADSGQDMALKVDPESGEIVASVAVPAEPVGVAIDHDGHVWVVSEIGNTATKMDTSGQVLAAVTGLKGPYTYSDMTGSAFRVFRHLRGSFVGLFDIGHPGALWRRVAWEGQVPDTAHVTLRLRAADGEPSGPWTTVAFGGAEAELTGLTGRRIEVEVTLEATVREDIPSVERLTFEVKVP